MGKKTFHILLVEDNPADVELTRNAFKEASSCLRLDVAEDGDSALALLRGDGDDGKAEPPDLVLLDLNLPGTDGMEVLRAMRSDDQLKRIPVVVLTSSASPQDVERCYDLFASAYVVKPMIFDRFVEIVKQIESFWFDVATLATDVRLGKSEATAYRFLGPSLN